MESDSGAPSGPRLALVVLSLGAGAWAAVLAGHGWFVEDDLWSLTVATDLGWGWDLLGRDVFGHVSPGFNALIWLVAGPGGGRYGVAVAEVALLAAAVPASVAAAARSLGARRWPAVVAATVATASVVSATASTWWTAALVILPSLLATAWTVVGIGRARRGHGDGAWIAAIALFVGMSASEGAAVVLVLALALAAAPGPGSLRQRVAGAWGAPWRWWIVLAPFAAAAAVRASASTPLTPSTHPSPGDLAAFPIVFVVRGLLPTFAGLASNRVEAFGSPAASVVLGVVAVALAAAVFRRRLLPGASWALGGVAAVFVARGVVIAWGRLTLLGWEHAVEVRYVADLAWLVPAVLAAWWKRPTRADPYFGPVRRPVAAALALAAGVVVVGLVGQVLVADRAPSADSRAYREHLIASWSHRRPGATVIDAIVPGAVLGPQWGEFLFVSRTVDRDGLHLDFDPSDRLLAPDDRGVLGPVTLGALTSLDVERAFTAAGAPTVRHEAGCWVAGAAPATVWVPLARPVTRAPYVLDLALSGPSSRAVGFVAAGTAPQARIGASPEGRGPERWLVSTLPFAADQIGFELPAGERLCLGSGEVSIPVAEP